MQGLVVRINRRTLECSSKAAGFFPLPHHRKTEFSGKASCCRTLFQTSSYSLKGLYSRLELLESSEKKKISWEMSFLLK